MSRNVAAHIAYIQIISSFRGKQLQISPDIERATWFRIWSEGITPISIKQESTKEACLPGHVNLN